MMRHAATLAYREPGTDVVKMKYYLKGEDLLYLDMRDFLLEKRLISLIFNSHFYM